MKNKIIYILSLSILCCTAEASGQKTSISLAECREMAGNNNPYMLNSQLDVLAAQAQKREAFAGYFPKVSVNAFSFYAFDPMLEIGVKDILGNNDFSNNLQNIIDYAAGQLGFDPIYSTLKKGITATVSVMQPVFAGGRIVNGNRLAAIGLEAAGLKRDIQLRSTDEDIEKGYWQVVALEEKMKTLDRLQELVDTLYKDVSSAVSAGLATENDLLQVKLKRNELKSGKIQVRNGIRLAKMNLFNAIGLEYTPYSTIQDGRPFIDDISLSDRLDSLGAPDGYYRPEEEIAAELAEARLLELSVQAKRIEKKMILGETLPQIGVGASYGYNNFINKGSMNGAVFAMVQIPISDWGANARKLQRHEYQIQKAENEKQYLDAQLTLQVRQLWLNLTASWEQMQVAKESVETAQASVRQLEAYYKAGMSPLSELLQAQTGLRECAEQYIEQQINYQTALQSYLNRAENRQ